MQKLYLSFGILLSIGGCATPQAEPPGRPLGLTAPVPSNVQPVKAVDIADYAEETVCEDIQRPGSRIVVGKRCYTRDARMAAIEDEFRQQEVMLVQEQLRREQENMERMQRELEMQRQRALMRQGMR